ncbi:MAG: hypothetical protein IIZ87_04095, partial [Selenomonas sp.]|nr:hypothetical protein [Selenomonas sp.]
CRQFDAANLDSVKPYVSPKFGHFCLSRQIYRIKFGLYHKLVYICIAVKADCAAALGRKNELNN